MGEAVMNEFQFQYGKADYARLNRARLKNASLDHASLQYASFFRADLEGASLREANVANGYLLETNFTGANLQGIRATRAVFDGAKFAPSTRIEGTSHDLIAALLENTAQTFEEHMFAAGVRSMRSYCWQDFTEELRERPALLPWIERTLSPYPGLAPYLRRARGYLGERAKPR